MHCVYLIECCNGGGNLYSTCLWESLSICVEGDRLYSFFKRLSCKITSRYSPGAKHFFLCVYSFQIDKQEPLSLRIKGFNCKMHRLHQEEKDNPGWCFCGTLRFPESMSGTEVHWINDKMPFKVQPQLLIAMFSKDVGWGTRRGNMLAELHDASRAVIPSVIVHLFRAALELARQVRALICCDKGDEAYLHEWVKVVYMPGGT